jgi:hypothetical protein
MAQGFTLPPAADSRPADVDLEDFTAGVGGLGSVIPPPTYDLDAARARRREAEARPAGAITIGGDRYDLPAELPLGVLDTLGRLTGGDLEALGAALRLMFPDEVERRPDPTKPAPPEGARDDRELVDVVVRSPATELLYRHRFTVEDFQELFAVIGAPYGLGADGTGLPPS